MLGAVLMAAMLLPAGAAAQVPDDVWRGFAGKLEVGTELNVSLRNGQRFRAMLVDVRDDVLLLQPKTRVAVPVQAVAYDAVVSLERRQHKGMGAAKAAAVGVATGAGVVVAFLAILFASVD
jgi:hypothetical protein